MISSTKKIPKEKLLKEEKTFAQKTILEKVAAKNKDCFFQDYSDYSDNYGDSSGDWT